LPQVARVELKNVSVSLSKLLFDDFEHVTHFKEKMFSKPFAQTKEGFEKTTFCFD